MNKEAFKFVKRSAKQFGIKTVCSPDPDLFRSNNGLTVAFRPAIENSNCRMLEVAVSYCAPEDTFDPKVGKYHARRKLLDGQFVSLPLGEYLRNNGIDETREFLVTVFQL